MTQNKKTLCGVVEGILFVQFRLKGVADLDHLDGQTLAEIYKRLKAVQEEHGLSNSDMEDILDRIESKMG